MMDFIRNITKNIYSFLKPCYLSFGPYAKIFASVALCALFFLLMYGYGITAIKRQCMTALEKIRFKSNEFIHSQKSGRLNYDVLATKLNKSGASYYFKNKLTPLTFIAAKALFAMFGIITGFILSNSMQLTFLIKMITGILFGVLLFLVPDLYLKTKNSHDNQAMQEDIIEMNNIIILQAEAGTYITQILIDAYLSVKNNRLKSALLELTGNIKNSGNIKESLEIFQQSFDNEDLANMAVALSQGAETGDSVHMLEDIKKHATIMQHNYEKNIQQKVKARNFVLGILIFAGAMTLIGFGLLTELSENIMFLNSGV